MGYLKVHNNNLDIASVSVFLPGDTETDLLLSYDSNTGDVYFNSVNDGVEHSYIVVVKSTSGKEVQNVISISCSPVPVPVPTQNPVPTPTQNPTPVPVSPTPVPTPNSTEFIIYIESSSCGVWYQLISCIDGSSSYTSTAPQTGKTPIKNGTRYYFTGSKIDSATEPQNSIGAVSLIDGDNGCETIPSSDCENLANVHLDSSTYGSPHHFADVPTGNLVGVLRSEQGEVNAYGTWVSCVTLGYERNTTNRICGYKIPYSYPVNVQTRTNSSCDSYPDARSTEYFTSSFENKTPLSITPSPFPANLPIENIKISTNMHSPSANDIFGVIFPGNVTGYKVRINQGQWTSCSIVSSGDVAGHTMSSGFSSVSKDFILDVTDNNGATFDRFVCRGNTTGGHYSSYFTITRLSDNVVFLSTTIGRVDTTSYIKFANGAKSYGGTFGDCFYLGAINLDINVIFGFESGYAPVDWLQLKLLSKDN